MIGLLLQCGGSFRDRLGTLDPEGHLRTASHKHKRGFDPVITGPSVAWAGFPLALAHGCLRAPNEERFYNSRVHIKCQEIQT